MNQYIVKLNNIKIKATHGLYDIEKEKEQLFEFDVAISFSKENCNDSIKKSINYENIYYLVKSIFKGDSCFNLIETLGEEIIDSIYEMGDFNNVTVTIRKPEVQFDGNSNCIEVTISRNNE